MGLAGGSGGSFRRLYADHDSSSDFRTEGNAMTGSFTRDDDDAHMDAQGGMGSHDPKPEPPSPLKPSPSLLVKLGSIIVHMQELTSPAGHIVDKHALDTLWSDPEVVAWIEAMDKMAFLPK